MVRIPSSNSVPVEIITKNIKHYTLENEWCFRQRFCTVRLYWAGDNWDKEMNIIMNHAPGAGSITGLFDQQSNELYHCTTDAPYYTLDKSIPISIDIMTTFLVLIISL